MSKFKKTCFTCGAKVDSIIEGRCEECFRTEFPPIQELKQIGTKYCNQCRKITFSNAQITQEEFEERLPTIIKKHLIINENYILNEVFVNEFKIKGERVTFDFEVDCDMKTKL